MTFNEYVEAVERDIMDYLPRKYQHVTPQVHKVDKNNGTQLTGLTLRGESTVCPNIYLESYYNLYKDGMSIGETLEEISEVFQREMKNLPGFSLEDFTYENMKDNLYYTVVNAAKNEKMLQEIPHQRREDLAIVYRVQVSAHEDGIASILLKNEHLDYFGVDTNTLHEQAIKSMPKIMPHTFQSMNDIMAEILDIGFEEFEVVEGEKQMWVLSNEKKMQGAAYIFDDEVMSSIAEKLGGNLIVIPSSIHEIIILKEEEDMDLEYIHGMVSEVNESEVGPEEVLSNEIYRFNAKENKLSLIEDFAQNQSMSMNM